METRQIEVDGRMVFDHRVEIRDPKTGRLKIFQPYDMHVDRHGTRYESPPKSGKFFNNQGILLKDISQEVEAKQEAHAGASASPIRVSASQSVEAEAAAISTQSNAPSVDAAVASAEAEAQAILQGNRSTVRKRV